MRAAYAAFVTVVPGVGYSGNVARTVKRGVVSRNPRLMNGALVFAGTRVPVDILVDHLASGISLEEFLDGFPGVSREQAVAYLEMARDAVEDSVRADPAG